MKPFKALSFIAILFTSMMFVSCEEACDCEYVTYDSDPTNNYNWTETYRSTWDASCEDEILDESTYTISGQSWYSRTEIQCK
jgi:hypothetical protein